MLTGAARRGAASVGSLLIAAVPSSPIESDGFPTSYWCGMRRGLRRAGGVLRVGMFAVLFVFLGCFVGGGSGGAALRRVDWPKSGVNLALCMSVEAFCMGQFPRFSMRSSSIKEPSAALDELKLIA